MTSYPPKFQADQEFDRFRLRSIRNETPSSPYGETVEENSYPAQNYEEHPVRRIHLQQQEDDIRNLGFFKRTDVKGDQGEDEAEWQERQSPINFILIAGILFICTAVGWFGYRWYTNNSQALPPILQPEAGPFKVRPENPGGMIIPHQDKLVYGRLSPEQYQPVERLLPPPEQPVIPAGQDQGYYNQPYPGQGAPAYAPQGYQQDPSGYQGQHPQQGPAYPPQGYQDQGYAQAPYPGQQAYPQPYNAYPDQPQPAHPQQGYAPQPQPQPYPYPAPGPHQQQGYTQPMQPAQPYQHPQGHVEQAPMAAPQQMAPLPPQQNPSGTPRVEEGEFDKSGLDALIAEGTEGEATAKPKKASEKTIDEKTTTEKAAAKQTKAEESAQAAPASSPAKGPYMLQVATFTDKSTARTEIDRLIRLEPTLFKDKKFAIQRMELGPNKGPVYRVIIGSFSTSNQAAQFRGRLKAHNVKGIVIKSPPQQP